MAVRNAVGRTFFRKEAENLSSEWKRAGYTPDIYSPPAATSNKTIYTVYVRENVPAISAGEFEITHPRKGAAISRSR